MRDILDGFCMFFDVLSEINCSVCRQALGMFLALIVFLGSIVLIAKAIEKQIKLPVVTQIAEPYMRIKENE